MLYTVQEGNDTFIKKSFHFFSRFIAFAKKVFFKVLILHDNKNFLFIKNAMKVSKNAEFAADKKT